MSTRRYSNIVILVVLFAVAVLACESSQSPTPPAVAAPSGVSSHAMTGAERSINVAQELVALRPPN